jgi:hypothetical protein
MVIQQEQKSPHECYYPYAIMNGTTSQKNELSINQFLIRIKFYSAMDWTVQESNPGGGRFSAPIQAGLGAHPVSHTMDTGFFSGLKRSGPNADHPPHLWAVAASSTVNFMKFYSFNQNPCRNIPTVLACNKLEEPSEHWL